MDSLTVNGHSLPQGVSSDWTNPELDPGVGLGFNLAGGLDLFLQMKMAMDFKTTTVSNVSKGKFYSDNPIILFPLQIGMNFKF